MTAADHYAAYFSLLVTYQLVISYTMSPAFKVLLVIAYSDDAGLAWPIIGRHKQFLGQVLIFKMSCVAYNMPKTTVFFLINVM